MRLFGIIFLSASFIYWTRAEDVVCSKKMKKVVTIGEGDTFSFRTQSGTKYAASSRCQVTYKTGPSCPSIKFSCSEFNLKSKKANCKGGDKMTVVADGKNNRYCKRSSPNVTTSKTIRVVFTSNKKTQASGAQCTAQCASTPSTTPAPSPTGTSEPVPGCPKETPKFNTACHPSEEGLTCPYGSQTCCGEISPETVMECRQEMWVGYVLDTVCMLGGPCPGNETTPPASCICPEIYTPVCGSDGKTYSNDCFAKCKGVGLACSGECPCDDCVCPAVYDPVCGSDDKTYSNTCSAGCKGVGIACSGECPCADCICLAVFAPVCGSDGRTYSNECQAVCAGVKTACLGECPCTLS